MQSRLTEPNGNHNRTVVNSPLQKNVIGRADLKFEDNRTEAKTQAKLRDIANNSINQKNAAQLKIKIRSGAIYDESKVKETDPDSVQKIKKSGDTYLMQSVGEVTKIENSRFSGVEVLTPAKHLIGEIHKISRFQDAIQNWGWGADKMFEKLSSHPRMKRAEGQQRLMDDPTAMEYHGKPLENTVAKQLVITNLAEYYAQQIKIFGDRYASDSTSLSLREKTFVITRLVPLLRGELGNLESIKNLMRRYKKDSPGWYSKKYKGAVDFPGLAKVIELVKTKNKSNLLLRVHSNLSDAITFNNVRYALPNIDALITLIHAIKNAGLAIIKAEDRMTYDAVDMDTKKDSFKDNPTEPTDAIREHYMAENIKNNLNIPGIVKVGSGHIPGLTGLAIPNAKLYNNYTDFVKGTDAEELLETPYNKRMKKEAFKRSTTDFWGGRGGNM